MYLAVQPELSCRRESRIAELEVPRYLVVKESGTRPRYLYPASHFFRPFTAQQGPSSSLTSRYVLKRYLAFCLLGKTSFCLPRSPRPSVNTIITSITATADADATAPASPAASAPLHAPPYRGPVPASSSSLPPHRPSSPVLSVPLLLSLFSPPTDALPSQTDPGRHHGLVSALAALASISGPRPRPSPRLLLPPQSPPDIRAVAALSCRTSGRHGPNSFGARRRKGASPHPLFWVWSFTKPALRFHHSNPFLSLLLALTNPYPSARSVLLTSALSLAFIPLSHQTILSLLFSLLDFRSPPLRAPFPPHPRLFCLPAFPGHVVIASNLTPSWGVARAPCPPV